MKEIQHISMFIGFERMFAKLMIDHFFMNILMHRSINVRKNDSMKEYMNK